MSEYGEYSQRIFQQSERKCLGVDSEFSGEYIDFNPHYSFSLGRIQNPEYQTFYYEQKNPEKDTDCAEKAPQIQENTRIFQRRIRRIQTNSVIKNNYLKVKRGTASETMELNINFKTIFCRVIKEFADLKLLRKEEKQLFFQYKSESPSFKSLSRFLKSPSNQESKIRLKKFVQSSQLICCIQQSDTKMWNKITMFKYLEVMREMIGKGNENKKWKQG